MIQGVARNFLLIKRLNCQVVTATVTPGLEDLIWYTCAFTAGTTEWTEACKVQLLGLLRLSYMHLEDPCKCYHPTIFHRAWITNGRLIKSQIAHTIFFSSIPCKQADVKALLHTALVQNHRGYGREELLYRVHTHIKSSMAAGIPDYEQEMYFSKHIYSYKPEVLQVSHHWSHAWKIPSVLRDRCTGWEGLRISRVRGTRSKALVICTKSGLSWGW